MILLIALFIWEGATPGVGGSGNTHSTITNVYELNKAMEIARSHLLNNNWLKQRLTVI